MSGKLPPKHDPERTKAEQEALQTAEKATKIAGAFGEGKLPTTEQIVTSIESLQDSDAIHATARGMSPLGKKVFADTEKFLESTKDLLVEKNAGDELQNVIYYGSRAARDIGDQTSSIPEDLKKKYENKSGEVQSLAKEAWQKALMIPQLMISSSEFRKLINEINIVIQEAIATTDSGQETADPEAEETLKGVAQKTSTRARESAYPLAKKAAGTVDPIIREFSEGKKSFHDAATEGAKSLATNVKERVTSYHLSPEQRERITARFKNVMKEAQRRPEYQEALSDIIDFVCRISEYTREVASHVSGTTAEATGQSDALRIAQQNAKELLENFSNNYSLDLLINSLSDFSDQVQSDEQLRDYLRELQDFVLSSLQSHEYIQQTDYNEHGSRLIERGRHILLENYYDTITNITNEFRKFNESLQEDKTTLRWKRDFENLVQDIFLDEKGRPTMKFELIKDCGKILTLIAEKLKFFPLPRMEKTKNQNNNSYDDQYEYIFDNIVLHVSDIIPKHLHISMTSDINLDREGEDVVRNTALIEISKLRADARNIAFFYKKKGGLITMKDVGLVDFAIPSDGLRICINILLSMPTDKETTLRLTVLEAETNIKELKIRLHDTRHDFLYVFLTPLVEKRLKKQLENIISDYMRKSVEYVQENLNNIQIKATETYCHSKETQLPRPTGEKLENRKAWESNAFGVTRTEE
ncbi:12710_t:CDS:2 [Acaulospora colombiana]|uniref:12710_t:CDS:1 n=1 Tax=Acaulospora colombiana TaxID=27376 RepID=A0ACA9LCC5_9GLOM|nr:12710_t:CDS:2 [Acaulospora colombiana]